MSNATPTPKVAASGLAGAVTVILVWVAGLAGLEVPAEVATSVTFVLMIAVAYMVPDGTGKRVRRD